MSTKYKIYIALFLLICLIPSAGLVFAGREQSSENRQVAHTPVLYDEDGFSQQFLSDA